MSESSTRHRVALQGFLAAAALLIAITGCGGGSDSAGVARWQQAASSAITPMAQRVPTMAQQEYAWEQGTLTAEQYRSEIATTLSTMSEARARVSELPPYPGRPAVDRLYLASMTLYVASAQSDQASLDIADADLRRQVALLAERVRELGDRVFDQGRLLTGQSLVPAGLSGARVDLPSAVPDWTAEGLAAGPPLAAAPVASVVRPGTQPKSGPQVRIRLSELVNEEAQVSARAAGLSGPPASSALQALASSLKTAARLVA